MQGSRWVIIDTETDGLYEPIHVLELSGQLMEGWEPVGEPFRMLLNHKVPIPPEATAIHGYTEDYLAKHGRDPHEVYAAFRDYARDYPLVAHNLSYDWNRCLEPEWARLGIPQIGQRGFCCMMLARRVVGEVKSYRLETLKQSFDLTPTQSHQAKNDVLTVVELFRKVYRDRLESTGLNTFATVAEFAKRTPVAKCLAMVGGTPKPKGPPPLPKDEWYYLDQGKNTHGPLPARAILELAPGQQFYIWRVGMQDWQVSTDCSAFLSATEAPSVVLEPQRRYESEKTMGELIGLCRGLIADDKITTSELIFLNNWLQDAGFISEWPASQIAQTLERILEDNVVTREEKEELKALLKAIA
jgi:DNA polymerase III epsilon subunit-like protein